MRGVTKNGRFWKGASSRILLFVIKELKAARWTAQILGSKVNFDEIFSIAYNRKALWSRNAVRSGGVIIPFIFTT